MAQDMKSTVVEVGLQGAGAVEEQTKMTGASRPSKSWKIGMALLAIGLCAASAIFFTINNNQKRDVTEGSEGLTHHLRQISKRHQGTNQMAIHLEGEKGANTLTWSVDTDQAFERGLKLVDNEIVIPKKGMYFVYSQVSFSIRNCGPEQDLLSHAVMRQSKVFDGKRALLRTVRSSCERKSAQEDDYWYGAINLGAVFSLEEGDRLSTLTQPMASVEDESGKTFFGVFAL
ncbi:tumor necrosis factor-like [Sardina pilchardus]|uniref:tumor necrosis factor-like n=1 Tax=Sardina pilchardus TaxID=27697 RepID=UPI002E11A7AC